MDYILDGTSLFIFLPAHLPMAPCPLLELWWFNHETNLFYDAKNRLIPQPQILPGYCVHCLREQTQRGEPAHLRAEWIGVSNPLSAASRRALVLLL